MGDLFIHSLVGNLVLTRIVYKRVRLYLFCKNDLTNVYIINLLVF